MNAGPRPRSLGELIAQTTVPDRSVGIFWPGGASVVFKSAQQRIYLIDPSRASWAGGSQMGAIDIKPDLVFCSLEQGRLDVSTLTHLATAFPEAKFAGSVESRDAMIGRNGALGDEVPVDPGRVHVLEHDIQLDVRRVGLADGLRIRVLNATQRPWNVLFGFAGGQVCVVRTLEGDRPVVALQDSLRRRIDVLLCALDGGQLAFAAELLDALRPAYAVPIGYDHIPGGREMARQFRDLGAQFPGVTTYLFAEDYLEGLVFSRVMKRNR